MVFLSFPLAPFTEYLCSLFPLHNLDDKVVFDKGIDPHGQLHSSGDQFNLVKFDRLNVKKLSESQKCAQSVLNIVMNSILCLPEMILMVLLES